MTTMGTKVKIEVKMYIIANNFFMSITRKKCIAWKRCEGKFYI